MNITGVSQENLTRPVEVEYLVGRPSLEMSAASSRNKLCTPRNRIGDNYET